MFKFNHFNFNVKDLDESLKFYQDIFGLKIAKSNENPEKGFKIVYLSDGVSDFLLELTWLKDHTEPYDLGEQEFHLALTVDSFDEVYAKHQEMGIIIYDNKDMGIYFIEDPDGYWIEVVPARQEYVVISNSL